MMSHSSKRIVIGISGASGAAYAQRLIRLLVAQSVQVHLVVSPMGQRMLHDELGMEGIDLDALAGDGLIESGSQLLETQTTHLGGDQSCGGAAGQLGLSQVGERHCIVLHHYRDVGAAIASGSFVHDGMVIIPCSSNSLSAVANGSSQNLLHRAAAVSLKEQRRLVLVHREAPLSMVDIRNMQLAAEAGAIICPANPGFYMLPQTIDDLIDFMVGRVLDLLGVEHHLNVRWGQDSVGDGVIPGKSSEAPSSPCV